jgi:hypothetical protein
LAFRNLFVPITLSLMSFTREERAGLRSELLELAARDARLSGAAVTGSAAEDREDRWSDIDLAFGVADPGLVASVLSDFSNWMYARGALHHHDVCAGAWIYRVFFLPGALQVDLAFVEKGEFGPMGVAFRLVWGEANAARQFPSPESKDLIGLAWLHALHARTCILRGKLWQAEHMIHATRDHVMALACTRHGLPSAHGRGMDSLPAAVKDSLLAALVGYLDTDELWRALEAVVESLNVEISHADPSLGLRATAEISNFSVKPPA